MTAGRAVPPVRGVDGHLGVAGDAARDLVVPDLLAALVVRVDGVRHDGDSETLGNGGHDASFGQASQVPTLASGWGSTCAPIQVRFAPRSQRTVARSWTVRLSP